jgi:hypothetical protein
LVADDSKRALANKEFTNHTINGLLWTLSHSRFAGGKSFVRLRNFSGFRAFRVSPQVCETLQGERAPHPLPAAALEAWAL